MAKKLSGKDCTNTNMFCTLPASIVNEDPEINEMQLTTTTQRKKFYNDYNKANTSNKSETELSDVRDKLAGYGITFKTIKRKKLKTLKRRAASNAEPMANDEIEEKLRTPKEKVYMQKRLTAPERKKLFDLGKGQQSHGLKFKDMIDLHKIWLGYITQQIEGCGKDTAALEITLCRADYHGALFVVSDSKNKSLIGATGIVTQETRNTFRVIGTDDRLLTIPKKGSAFSITICEKLITIYGSRITVPPSERAKCKFKRKPFMSL